jgi:hypothetical protein
VKTIRRFLIMIKVTLNIILLFIVSSLVPMGSFILPVYKIKNMPKLDSKDRLFANLISGGVIYFIDDKLFFMYVGFFLVLEGAYYIFERTNIAIFDRILITTIITTLVDYAYIGAFVGTPANLIKLMDKTYSEYMNLDKEALKIVINYMKDNLMFIIFTYLLIINYLTYFLLKGKSYRKWKISYLWIILYIGTFFVEKTLHIENFYIKNLYKITTLVYVIYGIRVLYTIFRKKLKMRVYGKLLAIATAIYFPIIIFILGAINSFGIIKITTTTTRGK